MLLSAAVALMGVAVSSPVKSQPQVLMSGLPGQEKYYNHDVLVSYYKEHEMRPIWVRGAGKFQPRIEAAIGILEDSWTHGLNPAHYRIDKIKSLAQDINADNKIELELLLSDAVVKYMHDLTSMRAEKGRAEKFWRSPMTQAEILSMVAESADPVAQIRSVEPTYVLYQSLRQELIRLAKLPADNAKPVKTTQNMKPGRSYKHIPAIREKMNMPAIEQSPEIYDEPLAVEVMKLQKDYNIDADGVIGPKTLELINFTREDKMMQIIANMERLRWINQGRPDRYVLVNIPSANLWAVDEGEVKLTMPVIVGKTARPTYSFKTEITGVRLNPNWTVPPTIKQKDFLPALKQDPQALSRKGIRISYKGRTVDPSQIDWSTIQPHHMNQVSLTQNPGDDNPLGKVRVIMQNPYDIYLHDTNNRKLFEKTERELSSGCIRVAEPEKLAEFLLGKNKDWDDGRLRKLIDSRQMRDVPTDESIPVFITYQTVWLNTDGRLVYGRDPYGQDRKLADLLKKAGAIHIPQGPEKAEISL